MMSTIANEQTRGRISQRRRGTHADGYEAHGSNGYRVAGEPHHDELGVAAPRGIEDDVTDRARADEDVRRRCRAVPSRGVDHRSLEGGDFVVAGKQHLEGDIARPGRARADRVNHPQGPGAGRLLQVGGPDERLLGAGAEIEGNQNAWFHEQLPLRASCQRSAR
jgi:hypothetical protein